MSERQGLSVLFLSRAFPPVIGGIENQNHALAQALGQVCRVATIANRWGKRALLFFLPWVSIRALVLARRFEVLLLGDGVMAAVGAVVKLLHPRVAVVCILHGLDVTWPSSVYQKLWVNGFFRRMDRFVVVSESTRRLAEAKGLDSARIDSIPNGIEVNAAYKRPERRDLEQATGLPVGEAPVLVTVGRLIRRKGVRWFIENVVPRLSPDIWYLVAGDGPERGAIEQSLRDLRPGHRVRLLGTVDEPTKAVLLGAADLFVQPNIRVTDDPEGFGIGILEAGVLGLPVVASALEGLTDAVSNGVSGWLVEPGDAQAFAEKITDCLRDRLGLRSFGIGAREYVASRFAWAVVVRKYVDCLWRARGAPPDQPKDPAAPCQT